MGTYIFTSESVTEGHPDKIAILSGCPSVTDSDVKMYVPITVCSEGKRKCQIVQKSAK